MLPEIEMIPDHAFTDNPLIDICMAVEEGRYIDPKVLKSIELQNWPYRLWISTQNDNNGAAGTRNRVKKFGETKYILAMDNDLILEKGSLSKMVSFLNEHPHFAAIGINKYRRPEGNGEGLISKHVDSAPLLWRKEVLDKITYEFRPVEDTIQCECQSACDDVRALGYEIGFLTAITCDHIKDTQHYSIIKD